MLHLTFSRARGGIRRNDDGADSIKAHGDKHGKAICRRLAPRIEKKNERKRGIAHETRMRLT